MVRDGGGLHAIGDAWAAFDHGVVYLPQDRKAEGIFPSLSILDNFRILTLGRSSRHGLQSATRARAAFARHRQKLDIVLSGPRRPDHQPERRQSAEGPAWPACWRQSRG